MGSLRIKTLFNQCELKRETSLIFNIKILKKLLPTVKQIQWLKARKNAERPIDKKEHFLSATMIREAFWHLWSNQIMHCFEGQKNGKNQVQDEIKTNHKINKWSAGNHLINNQNPSIEFKEAIHWAHQQDNNGRALHRSTQNSPLEACPAAAIHKNRTKQRKDLHPKTTETSQTFHTICWTDPIKKRFKRSQ